MDEPILTARLRMRPWETDDVEAARRVFEDPEVGRFVGVEPTKEAATKVVEANRSHQERHGFASWAVEELATGELIGEIGLQLLQNAGPEVEVGWVVARPAWGRGYATEAASRWLDVGFDELGLDSIIAVIRPENAASHRVARRLGMELQPGRRHLYGHDCDVYRVTREQRAGA